MNCATFTRGISTIRRQIFPKFNHQDDVKNNMDSFDFSHRVWSAHHISCFCTASITSLDICPVSSRTHAAYGYIESGMAECLNPDESSGLASQHGSHYTTKTSTVPWNRRKGTWRLPGTLITLARHQPNLMILNRLMNELSCNIDKRSGEKSTSISSCRDIVIDAAPMPAR